MKKRILIIPMVLLLAISSVAIGCPPPVPEVVVPEIAVEYVFEHIRVGWPRDIAALDPHGYPALGRPELNVHELMFDHLFYRCPETMDILPHLATGYEVLDDLTWRIFLREGVLWHDGYEFNADDVKYSIMESMLCPKRGPGLAGFLAGIRKVEIIDDFTVDIHTYEPMPTLLARLICYPVMVSARQRRGVDPVYWELNPIGTGGFRFVEWIRGDRLVFERFEDFWMGVPQIKNLTIYIIPDVVTRVAALKAGAIDIAKDVPPVLTPGIEADPNLLVTASPSVRVQWIHLRTDTPPFDDYRVRQAVNYAIDIEQIINELVYGFALPFGQIGPYFFWGYNPDIKPFFPYDPERARELLAEAGFPDGFSTVLTTSPVLQWHEISIAVAAFLGEVGIDVEIELMCVVTATAIFLAGDMGPMRFACWGNWSLFDIEGTLPFVWGVDGGWGFGYFHNERIEEIIPKLMTVDMEARLIYAREAAKIIQHEAPKIFILTQYDVHGTRVGIPEFTARRDNTVRFEWVMECRK